MSDPLAGRPHPWTCDWCWRDSDALVVRWRTDGGMAVCSCLRCFDPLPSEHPNVIRRTAA